MQGCFVGGLEGRRNGWLADTLVGKQIVCLGGVSLIDLFCDWLPVFSCSVVVSLDDYLINWSVAFQLDVLHATDQVLAVRKPCSQLSHKLLSNR